MCIIRLFVISTVFCCNTICGLLGLANGFRIKQRQDRCPCLSPGIQSNRPCDKEGRHRDNIKHFGYYMADCIPHTSTLHVQSISTANNLRNTQAAWLLFLPRVGCVEGPCTYLKPAYSGDGTLWIMNERCLSSQTTQLTATKELVAIICLVVCRESYGTNHSLYNCGINSQAPYFNDAYDVFGGGGQVR